MTAVGIPDWLGIPQITLDAVVMTLGVTGILALLRHFFRQKEHPC